MLFCLFSSSVVSCTYKVPAGFFQFHVVVREKRKAISCILSEDKSKNRLRVFQNRMSRGLLLIVNVTGDNCWRRQLLAVTTVELLRFKMLKTGAPQAG